MTRRMGWWCVVLAVLAIAALPPSAQALVIQRTGDNYVAWEAEDFDSNVVGGLSPWAIVADGSASGGQALTPSAGYYVQPGGGIATYGLQFATDGHYRLYFRIYSPNASADSMFRAADFNVAPTDPPSPHLSVYTSYDWYNDAASPTSRYVVGPGDVGGTLDLSVGSREMTFRVDRFVLSTSTSLTDTQLDGLWNWDKVTHAILDGNWAAGANWDNGAPAADMAAFIGQGHTMTLNSAGQQASTLTIGHDGAIRPGDGTLSQSGGDLTIAADLSIGINNTGTAGVTGTYTATGGTLTVGSAADPADLYIGYNTAGTPQDAEGTLDLSGASQFTAHLGKLSLGEVTSSASTGKGAGTLKLAETNTIYADEILVSWSDMHAATQLQSIVELGTTNTIETDTLTVGGRRGRALMDFAAGGTLTLSGLTRAGADLRVAYTDLDTSSSCIATMDLTGGTFNATLRDAVVGYHMSKTGTDTGTLTFGAGGVEADTLTVGTAGVSVNGKGNTNGTLNMNGGTFTVANTTEIGIGTGNATGTVNIGGGTFTAPSLTIGQGATDATYGDGTPTGTFHVSGGTAQINGDVTLGTGTAASTGTLRTTGGILNVAGNLTGGIGSSAVNADGGTLDITGDLKVDTLRVGHDGRTATVTAGGDVEIGASGILDIARNDTEDTVPTSGTLDLSSASSVTLNLDQLHVGYMPGNHNGSTEGTLSLSNSGTNTINTSTLVIGECRAGFTPYVHGALHLKADNTIHADSVYIARQKGRGDVDITSGGTLTLGGLSGAEADLYIGYNDQNTTSDVNNGVVNLTGGTFNATLDELVIGYHLYPWNHANNGFGRGTLTFNAGTVTANTVTVGKGDVDPPTGSYTTPAEGGGIGTLNINGGSFAANTIALGIGGSTRTYGTLTLNGGSLHVNGDVTVERGALYFQHTPQTVTSKIVDGDVVVNNTSLFQISANNNSAGNNPTLSNAVLDGLVADNVVLNDGGRFRFYISGLALVAGPYYINQPIVVSGDAALSPDYHQLGHDIEGGDGRHVHYNSVTLTNNAVLGMRTADGAGYAALILESDATVTDDEPGNSGSPHWYGNNSFTLKSVSSPSGPHTLQLGVDERFTTSLLGVADANTTLDLANASLTLNVGAGGQIDGSVIAQSGSTFRIASGTTTIGGNLRADPTASVNFTGADVTVAGTLLGDGTLTGPVQVSGTCAPGLMQPGILHTADFTFLPGSLFEVEIDGPSAGNGPGYHDQLDIAGTILIDEAWLGIAQTSAPDPLAELVIINNDGTDPVVGNFAGLQEGWLVNVTYGGTPYSYWISYAGGDGNDVVLRYAPEPGTLALFGLALPALLRRIRRRR